MLLSSHFALAGAASTIVPHPSMMLPFVLLLLAIALMPFVHRHWWEHHYPKVSVGLGMVTVFYYCFILKHPERLLQVAHEYLSFIALIGSLFVVSGGIHIQVKGEVKPLGNSLFLFIGAVLANLIGTTGASVVLIRPWIRMNRYRITAFHIVFFIFIISNAGGCLTPIGDPPLFLGYLKGIPFWWVMEHCWAAWVIMVLSLIGIFYGLDWRNYRRAPQGIREVETREQTWKIKGMRNFFFLTLILGAVFIKRPVGLSEAMMIAAASGSYFTTPKVWHQANDFTFEPIQEVAWLFAGIFATMVPALDYLGAHATTLGLNSAMSLYWLTGMLSAVLDNAPTYLTFLAVAMGHQQLDLNRADQVRQFAAHNDHELIALALGAVFFGAMTYIGNGPNFMVKAIAEKAKVEVPSFFHYVGLYALPILLPLCIIIAIVFFSPWRLL